MAYNLRATEVDDRAMGVFKHRLFCNTRIMAKHMGVTIEQARTRLYRLERLGRVRRGSSYVSSTIRFYEVEQCQKTGTPNDTR